MLFDIDLEWDSVDVSLRDVLGEQDRQVAVGGELHPDVYFGLFLDVPDHGVELKVLSGCLGLVDFE